MGGGFLRGLAFVALLCLVSLTACQASVSGGGDPRGLPAPEATPGLRT
jgi:hypothetical protein